MDRSDFWVEALSLAASATVVLALGWAAGQRGLAHRVWARLRERHDASINWCMAMSSVIGCA